MSIENPRIDSEKPKHKVNLPTTDNRGRNFVDIKDIRKLEEEGKIKKSFTCAEGRGSLTPAEDITKKFPKATPEELEEIKANYGRRITRVVTEDGKVLYSRYNENDLLQEEVAEDIEKAVTDGIKDAVGPEVTPDKIENVRKKIFINPRVAKAISVASIFIVAAYAAASMYGGKAQEVNPVTATNHIQTVISAPNVKNITSIVPTSDLQERRYPKSEIGEEVPNNDVIYKGGIANWETLETPEEYNQLFGTKLKASMVGGEYTISSENPDLSPKNLHQNGIDFKFVATVNPLENPNFDPDSSNWEGVGYMELPGHYDVDGSFVLDMDKITPKQLAILKSSGVEIMWQAKIGERNVKSGDTSVKTILGIQNEK